MISRKFLKIYKWWNSHYVAMLAVIYYVLSVSPATPPVARFLATLGLFTFASIGIASFGQLLNDATDVGQDVRSGTHNLVASNGFGKTAVIFLAVLVAGIVPWFWLPTTPLIVALLAAEYALFIVYSVPPVRLKDRGIWGLVADSLYAYVVPTTVTALVFGKLAGGTPPLPFMVVLVAWTFWFGFGHILLHQLVDEARDREDGIRTFVVERGWSRSFDIALDIVTVAALVSFVLLVAIQGISNPLVPAGFVAYLACALASWRHRGIWHSAWINRLPRIDRLQVVFTTILSDFVWLWHPLLVLAGLAIRWPAYLPVALIHMVVFTTGLRDLWRRHLPEWRRLARTS
jgi:4-hydroxybenzoate polyprenyltransferase